MTAGAEIRVSVSPGERRTALLLDDRLHLAAIERPARPDGVGDLHLARVSAVSAAMSGAFLLLASGETGFLPESAGPLPARPIAKAVGVGDLVAVRVTRAAQGGKGPRVTARLAAEEAAAASAGDSPRLLRRGPVAARRFASLFPDAPLTSDGAALAAELRASLDPARVTLRLAGAFDAELEAEFDSLADPVVDLGAGARLHIHPTPALTAIDVDAGSLAGGRDKAAHLRMNLAAAAEVARQIRLRELGGAILVDFAGLSPSRRAAVLPPLAAALAADPLRPQLLGLTRLGLVEILRSRVQAPLHEVLGLPPSPLTHGLAALRRAAREAAAMPGLRLRLRAAPAVLAALAQLPGALEEYAAAAGHALDCVAEPALPPGREVIEPVSRPA